MVDKPKNKLMPQSSAGSRSFSEGSQYINKLGHHSDPV